MRGCAWVCVRAARAHTHPPDAQGFTYTTASVLDGKVYSVSDDTGKVLAAGDGEVTIPEEGGAAGK